MVQTKNKSSRVREGRIELITEHEGNDLTFIYPVHGPNTYANVQSSIESAGLATPTMAETASLVHSAFNSDDKYRKEIKQLMKDRWLWAFTGTLYVPNKGAYVQDYPEIRKGIPLMDESDLVKKLEANDPNVRFVPFGFAINEMSAIQLAQNPYLIAIAGKEGAQKIAEVADKHRNKPFLYSFKSVDQPLIRVSALVSYWDFVGSRLWVNGISRGDGGNCYAFGVRKDDTGEASRAQK